MFCLFMIVFIANSWLNIWNFIINVCAMILILLESQYQTITRLQYLWSWLENYYYSDQRSCEDNAVVLCPSTTWAHILFMSFYCINVILTEEYSNQSKIQSQQIIITVRVCLKFISQGGVINILMEILYATIDN